ncbi:alpha-L-rhamnosidase C-terminal domain-containing protein [Microbacterium sp. HMH0099]|uniref:alpha-L-rhamnosidase C-terminal domain-containing protein n=1 Tax=Microbacterium sp. HMH0099 TaxID=3414026 RepID=UPI003BF70FB2
MPWAGDNALAVLTNAYAFADPQPTRDTLTALGRPRDGYINGIADYSLWWLISHDLFQVYFEDRRYLGELAPHIVNVLDGLIECASPSDGLLRTSDHPEQFAHAGPGGIFLDWGLDVEAGRVLTATQILWFWALRGAGRVLTIAGHPAATRAKELADKLSSTLREQAWDSRHERWSMYLGGDEISAYPNFLAPIAQLQPPEGAATNGMQQAILSNSAGTPFMRTFGLLVLARLGGRAEALSHLRRMWGGMQNEGSATFWEEFSSDDASPWEMYGRPFGKSLTHAWSAGPAAALPTIILGLEPVADGWREVSLSPDLGDLDWAGAVVPTPRGDIEVLVDRERVVVNLPADTTLLYGENRYSGSVVIPVDSVDASVK